MSSTLWPCFLFLWFTPSSQYLSPKHLLTPTESPVYSSYYYFPGTHLLMCSLSFLLLLNSMINHFYLFFGSTPMLFASLIRSTALVKPILPSLHLPLCNSMWQEASTHHTWPHTSSGSLMLLLVVLYFPSLFTLLTILYLLQISRITFPIFTFSSWHWFLLC